MCFRRVFVCSVILGVRGGKIGCPCKFVWMCNKANINDFLREKAQ